MSGGWLLFMLWSAALVALAVWLPAVCIYQIRKRLPDSLDLAGASHLIAESDIEFLVDLSYFDDRGERIVEQAIFERIFDVIDRAERYLLLDMFLFNSYTNQQTPFHRDLSRELTDRLVEKKRQLTGIAIDFITDPVNTAYGGGVSEELERLRSAGVNVIVTDLDALRDSNLLYSPWWRTFFQWFGNSRRGGWLPHPFSRTQPAVTLRSYLRLLNFKANHRKVIVADHGDGTIAVVGSANPHGGSSAHTNVAVAVKGSVWQSLYESERAVAAMSGGTLGGFTGGKDRDVEGAGAAAVRVVTEKQIKRALLERIGEAGPTDTIDMAQFYLSDRDIITALLSAAERGVAVRLVLDPNREAFGYRKHGIPNRQAAHDLVERSGERIEIRWYVTHGEQFHPKLTVIEKSETVTAILGSANLTRRNLDNFNVEVALEISLSQAAPATVAMRDFFERIWTNRDGACTVGYETFRETSPAKRAVYRIQEALGLSTF